jgi:hypothetical protein
MIINIHEPVGQVKKRYWSRSKSVQYGPKRTIGIDNRADKTLKDILGPQIDNIDKLLINGEHYEDWRTYVPKRGDKIDIYSRVGGPFIPLIISMIINLAISMIMKALMPTPKPPKGRAPQETFGISGIQNTTGAGTPKFVVYGGPIRVYPHLIGTRVGLQNPDRNGGSRRLKFDALYLCGDTGGDGYESITDVEMNGTKVEDVQDLTYEVRLGTDDQTVLKGFESASQVFSANLSLPKNVKVVYTTKLTNVDRITLIFSQVLFNQSSDGDINAARMEFKIERKLHGDPDGNYVFVANTFRVYAAWTAVTYYDFEFDTPAPGQYDIRIEQTWPQSSASTDPSLFNVQEEIFTSRNYPGSALLAIHGIASNQIQSIESLNISGIIKGKKVKRPLLGGGTETVWTAQRMWILWDMITHQRVGMGHRIAESFFDIAAADIEQQYLDETVSGRNGNEVRDECTVIVNDRKPGWDWIKDSVLGEVNGIVFLSGGKLKPAIRRPKSPNLLYSYPGNIIEDKGGAIKRSIAHLNTSRFNTFRSTFQNRDNDYALDVLEVQDSAIGSDPIRDNNIQFDTIKRETQIYRQTQILLRENILVRRRYSFKCKATAQITEPFDVDSLSLRSFQDQGQSGHVLGGSTVNTLVLDKQVTLDAVSTYQVLVRHQKTNVVERLTVTQSDGKYLMVTPSTPFVYAPEVGDLWAIGRAGIEIIDIITMDIRLPSDIGGYELSVVEYVPDVWTEQALPSKKDRRFFNLGRYAPLPLRSVAINEDLSLNSSGVFESVIYFDVVPSPPKISGLVTLPVGLPEPTDGVYLSSLEPPNDDYYNRWILKIVDGPGEGQPEVEITDYDGLTRFVSCDLSAWTELPTIGSTYEIRKERYGSYLGFFVEISDDPAGPWNEPGGARFLGTTGRLSGPSITTTNYYRFTPYSNLQVDGLQGRYIAQFTAQGDLGVPGDVQDFNAVQMGPRVLFTWTKNADIDISHYQIRIGNPVANTWDMAMLLADQLTGGSYETESIAGIILPPVPPPEPPPPPPAPPPVTPPGLPPGLNIALDTVASTTFTVTNPGPPLLAFIKAVDKSGNMSVNAASVAFDMLPVSDIIELSRRNELLEPTGIFNGMAYRFIDGAPYMSLAASAKWDTGLYWDGVTVWDTPTILAGEYSAIQLTLPRQRIARARMEVASPNFNQASYVIQEAHSVDGVNFTPYKTLTTGDLRMRAVKMKILVAAENSLVDPLLDRVQSVVEARIRTLLMSNKFIPAAGLIIYHDPPWLKVPAVQITSYTGVEPVIIVNLETVLHIRIGTPGIDAFANITLVGI